MLYKIVKSDDYKENRQEYLNMINNLFKNDNDKLANIQEITNHLDFILKDKSNSFLIFLMNDDELISMINGYEYEDKSWCLFSLFTKFEYRKKGYAENILTLAINEISKNDYSKIIVGIEKDNTPSIKLHEKVGFRYANCNWDDLAEGFPKNHLGYIYDKKIKLIPLKKLGFKELYEMYQDFPKEEVGSTNYYHGLSYDEFVIKCKEKIKEENIINQELNTTTKIFILVDNNKLIGELGIRTTLNDFWINKGSQIYYKIRLSERKKGYGNIILKLGLDETKKLGFKQVRINCDDNNIPSKTVILNNGGVLDIKSYKTKIGTSSSYIIKLNDK